MLPACICILASARQFSFIRPRHHTCSQYSPDCIAWATLSSVRLLLPLLLQAGLLPRVLLQPDVLHLLHPLEVLLGCLCLQQAGDAGQLGLILSLLHGLHLHLSQEILGARLLLSGDSSYHAGLETVPVLPMRLLATSPSHGTRKVKLGVISPLLHHGLVPHSR